MLSPLPLAVQTDGIRLTQILVNLLGNAIKFTDEGRVKLTVDAAHEDGLARFVFVVEDTGVGIRPDQLQRSSPHSSRRMSRPLVDMAAPVWAWQSADASPSGLAAISTRHRTGFPDRLSPSHSMCL